MDEQDKLKKVSLKLLEPSRPNLAKPFFFLAIESLTKAAS